MKPTAKLSRLEVKNADAIKSFAEAERKKKEEETREARNHEAEARQWLMLQHYLEGECGPGAKEAKAMLKRVMVHVKEHSDDPDLSKLNQEEKAFWFMLDEVFNCIDDEWLIDNEMDYQLDELLGEEGAQTFRQEHPVDERIRFLDTRLGPSWRAIQYDYPPCGKLDIEPEVAARFLRGHEAIKEIAEGVWDPET